MPDLTEIGQLASQIGVPSLIALFTIWYVFHENTKREKRVAEENIRREERLSGIIENHLQAINNTQDNTNKMLIQHDADNKTYAKQQEEANRYQRDEHKKLMEFADDILKRVSTCPRTH